MQKIINGECLETMKSMESNSIDFIVCDPPYGLNFMGKHWDKQTPNVEIWKECLRICKPGSMLAAFGGSRTHHHLIIALEQAGWEILDVIMWLYGSGFPKSYNKFGLDGYGTALKPAYEPIIIAMKPLDGTYAQNVEKWGIGGINIDDCRIQTNDNLIIPTGNQEKSIYKSGLSNYIPKEQPKGRWPANVIFDEEAAEILDEQSGISKSLSGGFSGNDPGIWQGKKKTQRLGHNDSGGASRFFYCAKASPKERNAGLEGMPLKECKTGCGGTMPIDDIGVVPAGSFFLYDKERDRFRKKAYNTHPTVKPISLMKYIITLLSPPNNPTCLDPFMGSGTTGIACKELNINFIGIEKEKEYCEIAEKRILFNKGVSK